MLTPYFAASIVFVPGKHSSIRRLPLPDTIRYNPSLAIQFHLSALPAPNLHLTGQRQGLYFCLPGSARNSISIPVPMLSSLRRVPFPLFLDVSSFIKYLSTQRRSGTQSLG